MIANGETKTVDMGLVEFSVKPSSITVPVGTRLVLHVTSDGTMDHDLQLEDGPVGTGMLSLGQHKTVEYAVGGHNGQAWCTVPGDHSLDCPAANEPTEDTDMKEVAPGHSEVHLGPQGRSGGVTKMLRGQREAMVFGDGR